ncbi:Histone chaperone ASF1-like protein [Aduncisulcus paluster]|uniref:Histone chaperone ASF1-like protein n=1 Tax=Aduncisulcus paluster TaxID=2918883 RepID=A0ABQ5KXD3_9EUKA|nr:Histone chaperone ASF1-like protein [Aduncisulcus paluster]
MVVIKDIKVENPVSKLSDNIILNITTASKKTSKNLLCFRAYYVGAASSDKFDQPLGDDQFVAILKGKSKFSLTFPGPSISKIPRSSLLGVTLIMVTCFYLEKIVQVDSDGFTEEIEKEHLIWKAGLITAVSTKSKEMLLKYKSQEDDEEGEDIDLDEEEEEEEGILKKRKKKRRRKKKMNVSKRMLSRRKPMIRMWKNGDIPDLQSRLYKKRNHLMLS